MTIDDKQAIRQVMADWLSATRDGDVAAILDLMTDDVVFLTPGAAPFGRDGFATAQSRGDMDIDATGEVEEIEVAGDWAFMRTRLVMTVTVGDAAPVRRSGYSMSVLRRGADGAWRVARDANLVTADE